MTTTRASKAAGAVSLRAARAEDVTRMTALIAEAHLPPLFIETFLTGFVVAERAGAMLGCGGLEMYGEAGVIRSVVVDPPAHGLGIGRLLAERLIAAAREGGARELYLFTQGARDFSAGVTLDEWSAAPRACWQYQFISQNPESLPEIQTMRMQLGSWSSAARIVVRLTPRGGRDAIEGWDAHVLRVRVAAPPVDGRANAALVRTLAKALGVAAARVSVVSGTRGRNKTVSIEGMAEDAVREWLR